MNAKVFAVILAALFGFALFNGDYREVEDCAIITALGIDKEDENLLVCAEIINNQSIDSAATATILYGKGKTMVEAIGDLSASTPKNLLFSHVGVVALGDTLNEAAIGDIEDFCLNNPQFTLSMKIIAAKSASELLCVKPYTLSITALEIVSLLNASDKSLSFGKYNSFISVERRRAAAGHIMALPYFETAAKDGKTVYKLSGMKILKDYRSVALLDYNQSEVFEILQNEFKSGNITVYDKCAFVKNCTVDLSVKLKNDRLYFNYDIKLSANKSGITGLDTNVLCNIITGLANSIFKMQDNDILALSSTVEKQYFQVYRKIKDNAAQYIKDADYKVVITFND